MSNLDLSPSPSAVLLGALVRGTLRPSEIDADDLDAAHVEILCAIEASAEVHARAGRVSIGAVLRALRSLGWPAAARCYALAAMRLGPSRAAALDARERLADAGAYDRAVRGEARGWAASAVRTIARSRLVAEAGSRMGLSPARAAFVGGVCIVSALGGVVPEEPAPESLLVGALRTAARAQVLA